MSRRGSKNKPKKSKGKGKGKGKGTQGPAPAPGSRVHHPSDTEIFAVITKILGGNHLEAIGSDSVRRVVRIPGRIRRRQWVRTGDLVLIEPWEGLDESKPKADLKYRYRTPEIRGLFKFEKYRKQLDILGVERPPQQEVSFD